jgi:hypothetical protein
VVRSNADFVASGAGSTAEDALASAIERAEARLGAAVGSPGDAR